MLDEYVAGVLARDAVKPSASEDAKLVVRDTVIKIRALPPRDPSSITPAQASLRDLLADGPVILDFDERAWDAAWAEIEAEADSRDRQDTPV